MNSTPLLRSTLWVLLVLMPIVAVLSFRSGDPLFSAMAATIALFASYMLRYGNRARSGPVRTAGIVIAVLMMVLGMATLLT